MRKFLSDQGRARVCAPRKTGQEGVKIVRRNRKSAQERRTDKKNHLWMDISYFADFVSEIWAEEGLKLNC